MRGQERVILQREDINLPNRRNFMVRRILLHYPYLSSNILKILRQDPLNNRNFQDLNFQHPIIHENINRQPIQRQINRFREPQQQRINNGEVSHRSCLAQKRYTGE